jgi:hypothetical protein
VKPDVTVVIPTVPQRGPLLNQALGSVRAQTQRVAGVVVEMDDLRRGAWDTRNDGMMRVDTEWTAFLDDDDLLLPHHVAYLRDRAEEYDVDMCWGWYTVFGEAGEDPMPQNRGKQWDPDAPHCFPITVLVKTELLRNAYEHMGGFQPDPLDLGSWDVQDFPLWHDILKRQGASHKAFPEATWRWRFHGHHSSGLPLPWLW